MPLVQGSALWNLQRVFNHPRSSKEPQTKEAKSVPSQASSFWKSPSGPSGFFRRLSSAPCASPKRSASAPHGIPDIPSKPSAKPSGDTSPKPSTSRREDCPREKSVSKSVSVPHTFTLKPDTLQLHETNKSFHDAVSSSTLASSQSDISLSQSSPSPFTSGPVSSAGEPILKPEDPFPNLSDFSAPVSSAGEPILKPEDPFPNLSDFSAPVSSAGEPILKPEDPFPTLSDLQAVFDLKSLPPKLPSPQLSCKSQSVNPSSDDNLCNAVSKSSPPKSSSVKSNGSQTITFKRSSCSSRNSSPAQSPLKSPPPPRSRRASTQGEQLPVTPRPSWSELLEARRRLLAVEGRRRALCALEMRVQQVHCVFLQAELRVARQREGLARLVEAAGRAEVQATVHGKRIRRALRHHRPRLLACALCVPWPSKQARRGGQHPRHPRCALFQGRSQVLRACVGGDELGTRD